MLGGNFVRAIPEREKILPLLRVTTGSECIRGHPQRNVNACIAMMMNARLGLTDSRVCGRRHSEQ